MLFELVVFGGIVFWFAFVILGVIIITCLEHETPPVGMAVAFIFFLLFLVLFTDFWHLFEVHPILYGLLAVGSYMIGGPLWAFPKWFFRLLDLRRKVAAVYVEFLREHDIAGTKIPAGMAEEFSQEITHHYELTRYGIEYDINMQCIRAPKFEGRNRERVLTEMCFWPWSLFWTLLENPIKWLFEALLDTLQTSFQKLSDKIFSGFDDGPPTSSDALACKSARCLGRYLSDDLGPSILEEAPQSTVPAGEVNIGAGRNQDERTA